MTTAAAWGGKELAAAVAVAAAAASSVRCSSERSRAVFRRSSNGLGVSHGERGGASQASELDPTFGL